MSDKAKKWSCADTVYRILLGICRSDYTVICHDNIIIPVLHSTVDSTHYYYF